MRDKADLTDIFATIHVERDSQKGIVIGPGGSRLRAVGTDRASPDRARCWARACTSTSTCRSMADWQRDPKKLDRLGF